MSRNIRSRSVVTCVRVECESVTKDDMKANRASQSELADPVGLLVSIVVKSALFASSEQTPDASVVD